MRFLCRITHLEGVCIVQNMTMHLCKNMSSGTSSRPQYKMPFSYAKYKTAKQEVKNWNDENRALFGPKMRSAKRERVLASIKNTFATSRPFEAYEPISDTTEMNETDAQQVISANPEQIMNPDQDFQTAGSRSSNAAQKSPSPATPPAVSNGEAQVEELESMLLHPLCPSSNQTSPFTRLPNSEGISIFNPKKNGAYAGAYPGVSKILEKTRPPEAEFHLQQWMQKMITQLGQQGFQEYQKELWSTGTQYHECIQLAMQGRPRSDISVPEKVQSQWSSVQHVLDHCEGARLIEGRVRHPVLHYSGVLDCLASYKGSLCVIDWKMSKREKASLNSTFDNPLQIAAYIGALNSDARFKFQRDIPRKKGGVYGLIQLRVRALTIDGEQCNVWVTEGLVVIAYESGQPAHAHHLSPEQCTYYWQQWLHRLHEFWTKLLRGDISL